MWWWSWSNCFQQSAPEKPMRKCTVPAELVPVPSQESLNSTCGHTHTKKKVLSVSGSAAALLHLFISNDDLQKCTQSFSNLLCVSSDEYEWRHEYRWEVAAAVVVVVAGGWILMKASPPSSWWRWGHRVEPINHRVANTWMTGTFFFCVFLPCAPRSSLRCLIENKVAAIRGARWPLQRGALRCICNICGDLLVTFSSQVPPRWFMSTRLRGYNLPVVKTNSVKFGRRQDVGRDDGLDAKWANALSLIVFIVIKLIEPGPGWFNRAALFKCLKNLPNL